MKQSMQTADKPTAQSASASELHKGSKKRCSRDCKFYVTGSEFDHVEDAELIATMVPSGTHRDD